ncbi:MAG: GNAT family N-acetyltransferase [Xenococcaceae cyanobacterium MO_207.B15]|nr:GNAT family N-acetyltransferase [Xenococcaceae cyanobacterium MO_207.B15]
MQNKLSTRKGTIADIPFLARIQYEASLPGMERCFWEDILVGTKTSALQFIESMLRAEASNWGNASDFLIVESQGKSVAAAAGYKPNSEDYRPLRLSALDKISKDLNWTQEIATTFRNRYLQFWSDDCRPAWLIPQAPWIIEYVAVLPEVRGQGIGKFLLRALLEEGRSQKYSHAGIAVINGNEAARHTYESIGFKPYQAFYAEYFAKQLNLDFPGVTKFSLCLN